MSSRLPTDEALEKEDWIDEIKKIKHSPPFPHLLQAQQAPALAYAKVAGRPGTGSYPAPSRVCSFETGKSQPEGLVFKWETRLCQVSHVNGGPEGWDLMSNEYQWFFFSHTNRSSTLKPQPLPTRTWRNSGAELAHQDMEKLWSCLVPCSLRHGETVELTDGLPTRTWRNGGAVWCLVH